MNRVKAEVELAVAVAKHAHFDMKYGDAPYHTHLERVAELSRPFGPVCEIVAWLHDTIEDTELASETIENLFGKRVRECVEFVTDPRDAPNRKAKKKAVNDRFFQVRDLDKVVEYSDSVWLAPAFLVKPADRLDNLRMCIKHNDQGRLKMYRNEHESFRQAVQRPINEAFFVEMASLLGLG